MTTVEAITCIHIAYPDPNDFGTTRRTVLVRAETQDGLVGWGEVIAMWPEACKAAMVLIDEGLAPLVVGRDPTEPGRLWDAMRRHAWWYGEGGIASMAIAGVDMALWDIAGKRACRPVHNLLGGIKKDRLPACASAHVNKTTERERVDEVAGFFAAGYQSCKLGFGKRGASDIGDDPDKVVGFVAALRRELGDGPEILVDIGNGIRWDVDTAISAAERLADLGVGWIEEPLYPTDDEGYARLKAATRMPVASGEREFTATGYRRLLETGTVDVVGVDPARVEGISGFRAVNALVDAFGKTINAHAWSTAITSAASLHLSLASENSRIFEFKPFDVVVQTDLVDEPVRQNDGWALPRNRPGLGVEVNEDVVDRLREA